MRCCYGVHCAYSKRVLWDHHRPLHSFPSLLHLRQAADHAIEHFPIPHDLGQDHNRQAFPGAKALEAPPPLPYDLMFKVFEDALQGALHSSPCTIVKTARNLAGTSHNCLSLTIDVLTHMKLREVRAEHDRGCDGMQWYHPAPKPGRKGARKKWRRCPVCKRLDGQFDRAASYGELKRVLWLLKMKAQKLGVEYRA